jgi:hypothetical protein
LHQDLNKRNFILNKNIKAMFTQISWGSYTTIVVVLLACYYLFVGLRYYRNDLLQLLSGKKATISDSSNFTTIKTNSLIKQKPHEAYMQQSVEEQNLYQLLQALSDEIHAFMNEAGNNKLNKDEITASLKILIAKYSVFKDSSFQELIQNLIVTECETYCSIHLSEEELSALWV